MTSSHELEQLLGSNGAANLELVRELSLDRSDVGLGFAPSGSIWSELSSNPSWEELPLGAPIELSGWQEQAGVFRALLPTAGEVTVLRGAARRVDERVVHLDARTEEVVLRASLESGDDLILLVSRSTCRFYRLSAWLEVPSIRALTGGMESEGWLSAEYDDLANSPGVADRVAAVGLLLRLWQPTTAEARARLLSATIASGSALLTEVKRWAAELSPATCARCADSAAASAEALEDALGQMENAALRGPDAARELATYVALERDRLESIFAVLALRGDVSLARGALERLDEQAAVLLSELSSAGVEHPLLERTAEVEPFAWWGAIAVA